MSPLPPLLGDHFLFFFLDLDIFEKRSGSWVCPIFSHGEPEGVGLGKEPTEVMCPCPVVLGTHDLSL